MKKQLKALKQAITDLENMTTDQFQKGGDKQVRMNLQKIFSEMETELDKRVKNTLSFHPRQGKQQKPKFDQAEINKPYYVYNYDTQNIEGYFDNEIESENKASSLANAGIYTSEHQELPGNEQAKINPDDLYMVYLEHNIVDTINGFLAIRTIEGGKILLYSKEEALAKANKFLGEVRMFTFEFDKEKHIII